MIGDGVDNSYTSAWGELKQAQSSPELNYETIQGTGIDQGKIVLTVECADDEGAKSQADITITVNDINEAPKLLTIPQISIKENVPVATVVLGDFYARDVDARDQYPLYTGLTYSLENPHSYPFTLTSFQCPTANTLGNKCFNISVANGVAIDYENMPGTTSLSTYEMTVRAIDSWQGQNLATTTPLSIRVENVNEPPVVTASQSASVPESATVGYEVIGALGATDPEQLPLNYAITAVRFR